MSAERYRFIAEWFDPTVKIKRKFVLSFYPSDGSVDMYDLGSKKLFLRRIKCESVNINDLFVGNVVNVFSRQLYIVGFGDPKTSEKFCKDVEPGIFIINYSGFPNLGNIISILESNDLALKRGKIIDKEKSPFSASSLAAKLEKQFLVLETIGQDCKNILRKLIHPDSPSEKPLKLKLGEFSTCCLVPDDKAIEREITIFFPGSNEVHCNTTLYSDSTCCIIKPHAVREKITGTIVQHIIDAGFIISASEVVSFNLSTASEFLEVYKGVVLEYQGMVSQLMSGPCLALEITKKNSKNVCSEFRTFVGPADPEIAHRLRPGTLRSTYGTDIIKNAVHCTDLLEDVSIDLDYIFRVLPA